MTTIRPQNPSSVPKSSGIVSIYQSSIGKKILTGLTGLGLVTFIIAHMLGNLLLFISPSAYNQYGHFLETVKPLLWSVEIVLLVVILVHASIGVQIYLNKRRARPTGYAAYQSAGQPSNQTISSRTMIWTGITLAVFIIWHLISFKFGPYYSIQPNSNSEPIRDLARLVIEVFHTPFYTFSYTVILVFLGFHLRHGIWSALQSLGLLGRMTIQVATQVSTAIAIAITLGFLAVPWAIYVGLLG